MHYRGQLPLFDAPDHWVCPNCACTDTTPRLPPGASRYHACPGLHGLNAPLVRKGSDVKVEAHEREDYLGADMQATGDDGKAYMNVQVTRADGSYDTVVNAGLASADLKS